MVTTNLPLEQWIEVLGSERLAGALLDRLTHWVHMQEANGASYRLSMANCNSVSFWTLDSESMAAQSALS